MKQYPMGIYGPLRCSLVLVDDAEDVVVGTNKNHVRLLCDIPKDNQADKNIFKDDGQVKLLLEQEEGGHFKEAQHSFWVK